METSPTLPGAVDASELKLCCAVAYQSEWARLLLGESFHPGGLALTERLGALLGLGPGQRVLDVAAGQGASAIFLAQRFGCAVLGVDYGGDSVRQATEAAERAGVAHLVRFEQGDAERLPVADAAFDALICECAFCTFPDKRAAASEFGRVLRPGGRVGLSDLTRSGPVPDDLQGLLAWIACIADAQPLDQYERYLQEAGLTVDLIEPCDAALSSLVQEIRARLLGAELLVKLKKIVLPTANFEQARALARAAAEAVRAGTFGYAILTAMKPG
ncbi:MAG TPA: methyltransferase domain-containing protein [Ktedonobacterales bacterium]